MAVSGAVDAAVPIIIASLGIVYELLFLAYTCLTCKTFDSMFPGVLTHNMVYPDVPNWVVQVIVHVGFIFAMMSAAMPPMHTGSPCALDGYAIPQDPGLSFVASVLWAPTSTCYPPLEQRGGSNVSSRAPKVRIERDAFYGARMYVWLYSVALVCGFGIVMPTGLSAYSKWRLIKARNRMIEDLRVAHPANDATSAADHLGTIAKINHLSAKQTEVVSFSFQTKIVSVVAGLLAASMLWCVSILVFQYSS